MPRPRKQLPIDIERRIRDLTDEGFSPSQIWRAIGEDKVDLKTVQRRAKEYAVPDASGPWGLADTDDPDAAALVLEVLPELVWRTQGRVRHITRDRAKWIVRIRRAAPSISPWAAYQLAMEYQRRANSNEGTVDLDLYLAFGPWENQEREQLWRRAVGAGYVRARNVIGRSWGWLERLMESTDGAARLLSEEEDMQIADGIRQLNEEAAASEAALQQIVAEGRKKTSEG